MHPSLARYVDPPPRHTLRYVALGTIAGTLGFVAAVSLATLAAHPSRHGSPAAQLTALEAPVAAPADDAIAEARRVVQRLAFEAFPAWVAANPELACPARLAQLAPFLGRGDTIDPWGMTYQFACQGVLWARSAGPDRRYDTPDDIRSDR